MARDYGYIISPSLTRYTFEPGTTVRGKFTLTNSFVTDAPEAQTFIISYRFIFQEQGKKNIYETTPSGKGQYDLTPWISLGRTEVTLGQNESVDIPYTITVPSNPLPGGKYAAILIQKKSSGGTLTSSGASLDDRVAYQIIGKVAGTEKRESEIVSFGSDKSVYFMWPNEVVTFTISAKNNGNVEFLPSGDIFVHQGAITGAIWNENFNPEQLVILPENARSYSVSWEAKKGFFRTDKEGLTINLDYFRIGKYHATAKIGYDQNNNRVVADRVVDFWIIPIPLLVAVLSLVAAGILLSLVKKLLTKRKKK